MKYLIFVMLTGCNLGIFGGATPETTKTQCADGSYCDNPYVCPAYAGKPCEAPGVSDLPTHWKEVPDAGK